MRGLMALRATRAGRALLEQELIFDDPDEFSALLRPPRFVNAAQFSRHDLPVYVHQQPYLDFRSSVVAKLLALRDLDDRVLNMRSDFIWIDTDRAASDKLGLRLYLPGPHGKVAVRFAPGGCDRHESRFIALDRDRIHEALNRMRQVVSQMPNDRKISLKQFERLKPVLETEGTLADLSLAIAGFLFAEVLSFEPRPVRVSNLIASRSFHTALETILNRQRRFVDAVNARIRHLCAMDVDPQVKPLPADYLPLFMTCPVDSRRLRLRLERDGKTKLACATDSSGREHRLEFGQQGLTLEALDQNAQWSPDISLPMLVNYHYSGMVAGKSSALYMLVFNTAMQEVLSMAPCPVLVPPDFEVFPGQFDSLLYAYLSGNRI